MDYTGLQNNSGINISPSTEEIVLSIFQNLFSPIDYFQKMTTHNRVFTEARQSQLTPLSEVFAYVGPGIIYWKDINNFFAVKYLEKLNFAIGEIIKFFNRLKRKG